MNIYKNVNILVTALLSILISGILLFIPQVQAVHIVYTICALVAIAGVALIIQYFITDAYKQINEYGFSQGVLFLILGVCGLIRAKDISTYLIAFFSIFVLLSSVINLQYALDLKRMKNKLWVPQLILALALTICATVALIDPFKSVTTKETFIYYVMLADGVFTLIANLSLRIILKELSQ